MIIARKLRSLLALGLSAVTLAGCGGRGSVPTVRAPQAVAVPAQAAASGTKVPLTVHITLPPPKMALKGFRVKHVNLSTIAMVDVQALAPGASVATPADGNPIALTNNQASATLHLTTGPNQVITVTGLDSGGRVIPGAVIQGVATVSNAATTTATINAGTTPTARVIQALDPGLAAKVDPVKLQSLVTQIVGTPTGTPPAYPTAPSLVDANVIAGLIQGNNGLVPNVPTAAMTDTAVTA